MMMEIYIFAGEGKIRQQYFSDRNVVALVALMKNLHLLLMSIVWIWFSGEIVFRMNEILPIDNCAWNLECNLCNSSGENTTSSILIIIWKRRKGRFVNRNLKLSEGLTYIFLN